MNLIPSIQKHLALFLFLALILASCSKTLHDVHFHGRVTLACDDQVPVKGQELYIVRYFDTGMHDATQIGNVVTDDDGYYSLFSDVVQKGDFMYYRIMVSTANTSLQRQYGGFSESSEDTDDIEMNVSASTGKAYRFLVKNETPFDQTDMFDFLTVRYYLGSYKEEIILAGLQGTAVDTSVTRFYLPDIVTCSYGYTKNGITTTTPADTLKVPDCLDTTQVLIWY